MLALLLTVPVAAEGKTGNSRAAMSQAEARAHSLVLSPRHMSRMQKRRARQLLEFRDRFSGPKVNRLYRRADARVQARASRSEADANLPFSRAGEPDPSRPNVLLIVSDDQPATTTPVMKKTLRHFARSGAIFKNAFVVTPICCPSRTQILSGQYGHNTRVMTNNDAALYHEKMWVHDPLRPGKYLHVERLPWISEIQCDLYRNGYRNAIFGKYVNGWVPTSGWNPRGNVPSCFNPRDSWIGFNKAHVMSSGNPRSTADTMFSMPDSDYFLAEKTNEFIRTPKRKPWFAYVALHSPHLPLTPNERYRGWKPGPALRHRKQPNQRPYPMAGKPRYVVDAALKYALNPVTFNTQKYALGQQRMVKSIDDAVASMFRTLRRTGQMKNTIVIFTSDNGHLWGDHGLYNKFYPYLESLRVPMMVSAPGLQSTDKSNRLVANIDIAPTIYHLTGVRPTFHQPDGYSMVGSYQRDWLLTEVGQNGVTPHWAARIHRTHHYIETSRHFPQASLYDSTGALPRSEKDVEFREFYRLSDFNGDEMVNLAFPSISAVPEIPTYAAALRRAAWEPNGLGGFGCYGTAGSDSSNPCP